MWFYIYRILTYIPLSIFFPTKMIGRKNLPKGKAILTANHTSAWDIVIFQAHSHEKKYILAKKELFKNKLVGGLIKQCGGISIDRSKADLSAIKTSLKLLSKGKKLVIFPEGTRNKSDNLKDMGKVKSGAAMLAIKSQAPIVPVWINRKPKLFRRVTITIGKPFELSEFYGQKLTEDVLALASAKIEEKIKELS